MKASLCFIVCNIVQRGITVITTPVFTRLMPPDEYGIVTLYQTWLNVVLVLVTLQICYAPFNNAMVRFRKSRDEYVSSVQTLFLFLSLFWFLVFLLLRDYATVLFSLPDTVILLMILHVFFYASMTLWIVYQRFEYHYMKLLAVTVIYAFLNTVLGVFLVLRCENKWFARILSLVISQGVCGLALCLCNICKGKTFCSSRYWGYSLRFGAALIPNSFCSLMLGQADRIVIQRICGNTAVAVYSIAYSIGTAVNIIKDALTHAFLPWFYTKFDEGSEREIRHRVSMLVYIMFILIAVVLLFAPEILMLMGGREYRDALWAIPPVAATVFFVFVSSPILNVQYYYHKLAFGSVCSAISVFLNLGLNILFVPKYGFVAAGYTSLAAYMLVTAAEYLYTVRLLSVYGRRGVLDHTKMILSCLGMVCCVPAVQLLYRSFCVRYAVIILLGVLLCFQRKKLLKYIVM